MRATGGLTHYWLSRHAGGPAGDGTGSWPAPAARRHAKVDHALLCSVVAVLDEGIDTLHEDLAPNMWRNPGGHAHGRAGLQQCTAVPAGSFP
jgi:hypothetical protein